MKNHKNFYGTKEQYIEHLKDRIKYWTKALIEAKTDSQKLGFSEMLMNQQQMLVNEGFTWEQAEAIEFEAYQ